MRFRDGRLFGLSLILLVLSASAVSAIQENSSTDDSQQTTGVGSRADVRPASFKDITPGKTTVDQLRDSLGDPKEHHTDAGEQAWTYEVGPFPRVDMVIRDDVVASIVIHLKDPAAVSAVARDLRLNRFESFRIVDDNGQPLGEAVPERGLLFGYAIGKPAIQIAQIVLDPITAEPFVLRAEQDRKYQYQRNLDDLRYAHELDPSHAHAYWLEAKLLRETGRLEQAQTAIDRAVELQPNDTLYQLTAARVAADSGDYQTADQLVTSLLDNEGLDSLQRAEATYLRATLMVQGPQQDLALAVDEFRKAADLGKTISTADDGTVSDKQRDAARKLQLDCHLAISFCLARGPWQEKEKVVPLWLAKARGQVDEETDNKLAFRWELLRVQCGALSAFSGAPTKFDPTVAAAASFETGRKLITDSNDPTFKQMVQWKLGQALLDAARIEQSRGRHAEALKYANNAHPLLSDAATVRDATAKSDYVLGTLEFLIGSLQAVSKSDHRQAIAHYRRALEWFGNEIPAAAMPEMGLHGERYVSMGISFWRMEERDKAVELTKSGAEMMEQAVREGHMDRGALAIPYKNLSAMLQALGNTTEAQQYSERATQAANTARRSIR